MRAVRKDRAWTRPLRIVRKGHACSFFNAYKKAIAVVAAASKAVVARNKTNIGERRVFRELP